MDLEEAFAKFEKGIRSARESWKDERTEEGVKADLIHAISASTSISGRHDHQRGFMKLSQQLIQNKQFGDAIDKVAQTILFLFPVEEKEPALKN